MVVKVVSSFLFFVALILLLWPSFADHRAIDIVHIQALTPSFEPLRRKMSQQVNGMVSAMRDAGFETRFGFATLGDKRVSGFDRKTKIHYQLGDAGDYCLKVDMPLDKPDAGRITSAFRRYHRSSSPRLGDWPQAVFEGLYRAVLAPKMGWSEQTSDDKAVPRVAVVVTDTISHVEGDVLKLTGVDLRPFDMTTCGMKLEGDDEDYDCNGVDYPRVSRVAEILAEKGVVLVFLVAPGGRYDPNGKFTPSEDLARKGGRYRGENGLMLWYQDQVDNAGFRNAFVIPLDREMTAYKFAINVIVANFQY